MGLFIIIPLHGKRMSSGGVLRYRSEVLIFEVLKLWAALALLEGCSAKV